MDIFTVSLWFLLSTGAIWFGFMILIGASRLIESFIPSRNVHTAKKHQLEGQIVAIFHILSLIVVYALSVLLVFSIYFFIFIFLIPVAPILDFIVAVFAIHLSWLLYRSVTHRPELIDVDLSTRPVLAKLVNSTSTRVGVDNPQKIYIVPFSPWGITLIPTNSHQTGILLSYHFLKGTPSEIVEILILAEQVRDNLLISRFHNVLRQSVLAIEKISMGNLLKVIPRVFDPSYWVLTILKAFSTIYLARVENDVFELICIAAAPFQDLSELRSARQFMNQRMESFRISLDILLRSSCEVHTVKEIAFSTRALSGGNSTTSTSTRDCMVTNELASLEDRLSLILQEQLIRMQTSANAFKGISFLTSYSMEMSGQSKQNRRQF